MEGTDYVLSKLDRITELSRPSRELYKQALETLDSIGYPSPPLRQLNTEREVEYLLHNTLPYFFAHRLSIQAEQAARAHIELRQRWRDAVRTAPQDPRPSRPYHFVDDTILPLEQRLFQELGPNDESPPPFEF